MQPQRPVEIRAVNLNLGLRADLATHRKDRRHPRGGQLAKRLTKRDKTKCEEHCLPVSPVKEHQLNDAWPSGGIHANAAQWLKRNSLVLAKAHRISS